ncbi:hypothetical protein LP52_10810 [Streptomonospora alba]|uniref:Uncharacterized protein n=1 Tax=Streptomonospora alba TaxID=183763 RepID=A0A0C2G6I4_9ACTN|nr:hypothetical protein [Streptomonospora alba]KIH98908.1 hypothetical protein LP52_10810 [Streptomonospora alba]
MASDDYSDFPIEIQIRLIDLNRVNSVYRVWASRNDDGSFGAYYASLRPRLNRCGSGFAPTLGAGSHIRMERLLNRPPGRVPPPRMPHSE